MRFRSAHVVRSRWRAARSWRRRGPHLRLRSTSLSQASRQGMRRRPPQQVEFFEANIRPVLVDTCCDCHTDDAKGGLRLDSREALLKGGETGPAIVPGDPDKSLLMHAIRRDERLPADAEGRRRSCPTPQIAAFAEWIRGRALARPAARRACAPAPAAASRASDHRRAARVLVVPAARAAAPSRGRATPSGRRPTSIGSSWRGSSAKGWRRCEPADRRTLIRRATLDLTGLPPTAEEIDAFEKDTSPDAFAKVVDRLLASPRYGEAWGRHWLDVARYGEDDPRSLDPMGRGYSPYPNAYLYRDWVVKAFNDDLPYDQFVQGAARRRSDGREARVRACCRRSASSASGRGTTTTARSRSRAPTSATIASTSSRAASSA